MPLTALFLLLLLPVWTHFTLMALRRVALFRGGPPLKVTVIATGLAILLTIGVSSVLHWENLTVQYLLFSASVSPLLGHIYFNIFALSETGRRIKLLVGMKNGKDQTPAELNYTADSIVDVRVKRLLNLGQIREINGRYTTRATLLVGACRLLKLYEFVLFPRNLRK